MCAPIGHENFKSTLHKFILFNSSWQIYTTKCNRRRLFHPYTLQTSLNSSVHVIGLERHKYPKLPCLSCHFPTISLCKLSIQGITLLGDCQQRLKCASEWTQIEDEFVFPCCRSVYILFTLSLYNLFSLTQMNLFSISNLDRWFCKPNITRTPLSVKSSYFPSMLLQP
jgi:hypothetical protein